MSEQVFTFSPDFRKKKREGEPAVTSTDGVKLTRVGSREKEDRENSDLFGEYIAGRIIKAIQKAKEQGKKLVFDMATGSTPNPVWPKLQEMIRDGKTDLSNVIVTGHEEAWGTYEKESHSDFDHYRRNFLTSNNIPIQEISTPEQAGSEELGNFVPMHLHKDIEQAAVLHGSILKKLRERKDTTSFGFYGVGTDGHIGEMQIGAVGQEAKKGRMVSYADDVRHYSYESEKPQLFRWQDTDGSFRDEDNVFWERNTAPDETGRAARENYRGIRAIMGIGWREMLRQEEMLVAFNTANKQLAFDLALEGSFSGRILNESGEEVLKVDRNKGEGEAIFVDLQKFARRLQDDGILERGEVERSEQSNEGLRCHELFQAIYAALESKGATVTNSEGYYQQMWILSNRYIGKRAPVSRLIRLRAMFGRPTELVFTPEVVKGTKFEALQ